MRSLLSLFCLAEGLSQIEIQQMLDGNIGHSYPSNSNMRRSRKLRARSYRKRMKRHQRRNR